MRTQIFLAAAMFCPTLPVIAASPPTVLRITIPAQGPVALAVLDSRPDVVSGERQESFVGLSRSLYGIPYPAHTQSKKPFAEYLGNLVLRALKLGGSSAELVTVSPYKGRTGAVEALKATGLSRLVLLEVRDWWFDKLIHTDLHHDLALLVLASEGQELGSTKSIGHDELGKSQRPERRDLSSATNDILASLFLAEPIVAAFSPEAVPVAASPPTCTVDQILKMKEAGLTQEQIEAACGSDD